MHVQSNSIEATVNNILREWRDLWPGGLDERRYSTLNLLAHCREGSLGFNMARCGKCGHHEWYPSSCGDRHCPTCLGPRQAQWAEKVCERLPDCPHFHMVFTLPCQLHDLFERNYRTMADALTDAAASTLKRFQRNNWKLEGAFLSVLHTWGSALNWHPHLHVLVSAGGIDPVTRRWRKARKDYSFPVKLLSAVFRAHLIARIEALDADTAMDWPEGWRSVEQRRQRRVELCAHNFNVFSKATLGNTRAVVRYLARYTSRIAMSNSRLVGVDEEKREVTYRWKDYRDGARIKERTVSGKHFIRLFTRHLVPKGYRRIRYFGWLAGSGGITKRPEGSPGAIGERAIPVERPACQCCQACEWHYLSFYFRPRIGGNDPTPTDPEARFSLVGQRAGP